MKILNRLRKCEFLRILAQRHMDKYSVINLGNIFDGLDDSVIRWLVALAMTANDLTLNVKLSRRYADEAEAFYFFRVSFGHLKEIATIVTQSERNGKITTFLGKLDYETQSVYQEIVKLLTPFDEKSISKNVLSPVRNECFHYPDIEGKEDSFKDLSKVLKALDKTEVRFSNKDKTALGCRYLFADAVAGHAVNSRLSPEIVDQISHIVIKIMQFIDHSLDYLKKLKR